MQIDNNFFKRLAKGISSHFGNSCEVVVHELKNGQDHTITTIENGHISNRKVGDGASEAVLLALRSGKKPQDHYNYLTRTNDGKTLKSTTIHIFDENENVIGILGINLDITSLLAAESTLSSITYTTSLDENDQPIGKIPSNVQDLLDNLIEESCQYVGKEVTLMNKNEKIRAMQFLDDKGAFLIKKSVEKVSKYFGISKFTLYNYLDEGK